MSIGFNVTAIIYGEPQLEFDQYGSSAWLRVYKRGDRVCDLSIHFDLQHADRVKRAVEAFEAVMNEEAPEALPQAAE